MSGNTFGQLFTVTTFGESHGRAIGCIVDGCPAGLTLTESDIQVELDKRKPGQSHYTTQRREADKVQILSGIFEEKTTGAPIALLIPNEDARSKDYEKLKGVFRPGHGDYTYFKKYGIRDHRGGGRASARETAARVAAGAVAKKLLQENLGILIRGYVAQIGDIKIDEAHFSWEQITQNPFYCPDPTKISQMEQLIDVMRKEGDSIGAKVNIHVDNMPVGLGEPVFDRLDADLAKALMSINAVKAVAIGDGFEVVTQKGSQHRDEMIAEYVTPFEGGQADLSCVASEAKQEGLGGCRFLSNHSGGILAGISTGQPLILSVAFKPPSSIVQPARSLNEKGEEVMVSTTGRHDPCVGIRGVSVCEAMIALVLVDHWLRYKKIGD